MKTINRLVSKKEIYHEKNLPTQEKTAQQSPRLPSENALQKRQKRHQTSPQQGQKTTDCLIVPMQKQYRLNNKKVFRYLYSRGKSVASRHMVLIWAPSKYPLRVGFVVSKKIGKAVVRNKVRRRMRESFRSVLDRVAPNANYIVLARAGIDTLTYQQLHAAMLQLLKQAGALRDATVPTTLQSAADGNASVRSDQKDAPHA